MLKTSRQRKSISFILSFMACGVFVCAHPAKARAAGADTTESSPDSFEGDINQELLDSELGPNADADTPPPAEYPYPGATEEGIVPEDAPQTASAAPVETSNEAATLVEPNMQIERPKKIDEDTGDYYYETTFTPPTPNERDPEHSPIAVTDTGEYRYDTKLKTPTVSDRAGVEKPVEVRANGEFHYATEESPSTATASFRVGFFGPPMLENESTTPHTTFQDVYTKDQLPVLFADYEWPLTTKLGHLGLKFGSGIFVASGQGRFAVQDPARRSDDIPQERYTFFMFPNTLTAQYRFQYKDTQAIVPYVEGGAGYFTFAEFRDDNSSPRIGGALTTVVAGGVNLLMDLLDPKAVRDLDNEYGINHVFLTIEARQVVGLNKSYDFTSSIFNAGFLLQF